MSKLTRVPTKIFASSAASDEIGQFGSAVAGSKLETSDVATIQALNAWLTGCSEALVSGNRYISLQEFNGFGKVITYQQAYQAQEGIAEYDSTTTYYIGSIVKKTGTFELYGSLTDNNLGNALSSTSNWKFLVDLAAVSFADKDLSNITANGKNVISRLIMPNYSGAVSKVWNTLYTADMDGWVYVYSSNFICSIEINGASYQIASSSTASNSGSFFFPISKNETYKAVGSVTDPILKFIPVKGA